MGTILTITLNPAIDKSTSVSAMLPDKKMRCTKPVFEPGGGGVNVARALHKLGEEATAVYLAGGYTGRFFGELLAAEEIHAVAIPIHSHTRENLVVLDQATNLQYRFGMPGPVIRESEWQQLLQVVDEMGPAEFIVASGSVPEGVPADIFARIGWIARRKNARYIVDTSGPALAEAIAAGVYLAKPNLGELAYLTGNKELNTPDVVKAGRELMSKKNIEALVVSLGARGAMLVTQDQAITVTPPVVKMRSTVGAGDSMVAGMVLRLKQGKGLQEALRYGVACGTAATMNPGTELCKKQDADRILGSIQSSFAQT